MKVALISYSDQGGAGIACIRLHDGLREHTSWDVATIVRDKRRSHPGFRSANRPKDTFTGWLEDGWRLTRDRMFPPLATSQIARNARDDGFSLKVLKSVAPDVVNFHWLGDGFLSISSIRMISQPIVWTLHDMWAFTGGCHYAGSCDHYTRGCGDCPLFMRDRRSDYTAKDCAAKQLAYTSRKITVVSPSRWLASEARKSFLFKDSVIEVVPNSVNTQLFRPLSKENARDVLGLPQGRKLLLFGSLGGTKDPRKGFDLLVDSLVILSRRNQLVDTDLVVFGQHMQETNLPLPVHFLGQFFDELSMALVYSAADLMLIPSREDNLPNTALEALSCGVPCVAFSVGGLPDIVRPGINGELASEVSAEAFATAIESLLCSNHGLRCASVSAREDAVERYSPDVQARAYAKIFERSVSMSGGGSCAVG